ncbi:MAG: EamA/RhaT family transporter, partial [Gemmobacter sp.]
MTQDRILPGAMLMIAFCVLAPLLDVASKLATATI